MEGWAFYASLERASCIPARRVSVIVRSSGRESLGECVSSVVGQIEIDDSLEVSVVLYGGGRHPLAPVTANSAGLYLAANVAYAREWFERDGGFDERFRHPAGEDFDLAWRVLEAGGSIAYAEDAVVYHPVRHETFRDFRRRLEAWDAPRLLAKKHPRRFREFTKRSWVAHSTYYTLVDPFYRLLRWRRELMGDPSTFAHLGLRMGYQLSYGATQPIRRWVRNGNGGREFVDEEGWR